MISLGLTLALAVTVSGQLPIAEPDRDIEASRPQPPEEKGRPTIDPACDGADRFGGSDLERGAYCEARKRNFASVRTLADEVLKKDAQSVRGHFLMGFVQHLGEGNLPKALYHLEHAERYGIEKYGLRPVPLARDVVQRVLRELIYVHGEMDHHAEKIRYVDVLLERTGIDYAPLKSWPLLKLKRFDEARAIAKAAVQKDDYWFRAVGATALCAIESELRKRMEAYEACSAAAERVRGLPRDGAIELSNAGAAAEEIMRFDEAERLYTEATRRPAEGSVNPWGRLVRLYLRQGRFAEAVSAWRQMREYRQSRPGGYLDQQDQSEADLIGASVLIVAGRDKDALPITARTVDRPDRQGTSSADVDQNEAGAAIMDRLVRLTTARMLEEEAAVSPFKEGVALRFAAARLRLAAWTSGRRATEVLATKDRLVTTLRPECPGSLEMPSWLDPEVIGLVGPGVALAAIAQARKEETLPEGSSAPVFAAYEAEALYLNGDEAEALDVADQALAGLPTSEAMLRARVAAIAFAAAWSENAYQKARVHLLTVLRHDPGILRRMGFALPVEIRSAGSDAARAGAELLAGARLFEESDRGFILEVSEAAAVLMDAEGNEINRVRIKPGRAEDDEAVARRIAKSVLREILVPNVDITQADIRSLDGSMQGGAKASDRLKSIIDDVVE